MPRPSGSQVSASATTVPPDTAAAEERLLAAMLISGTMPVGITADDFAVEENARIFTALFALHAVGRPLTTVELHKRNPHIDPVKVCSIVGDFAVDQTAHAWLGEVYAAEVKARAQRRRGQEAA